MSTSNNNKEEISVPKFGLKLKLDHVYPEKRTQDYRPRLGIFIRIIPIIIRYTIYYIINWWKGRRVVMDIFRTINGQQIYGVPLGGIGAGTVGRGFRGEFCRFQLRPGVYEYETVDANQFIVTIRNEARTIFQSTLSTFERRSLTCWESLLDGSKCSYTGLYPRAWTEYDLSEYGVKLICRQISPVIPHNYKDSSIPCAVFVWSIINVSDEERSVTITFTFKNGTGNKQLDKTSTCSSKSFSYLQSEGVVLHHTINKTPCAYALSVKSQPGVDVSSCLHFNPNSDGSSVWNQLRKNGRFDRSITAKHDNVFGEMGVAVAAQVTLNPQKQKNVETSLVWDMPVVSFPNKTKKYHRFYTKFFGSENAILKMVEYSFNNYNVWESRIHEFQKKVLEDDNLPDWYKACLFNETYFVSDGGTIWTTVDDTESLPCSDPRLKFGRFAYLEGHEYRMYNTYDVHFYASFALIMNWPMLQLVLQYDMKDFIAVGLSQKMYMLFNGTACQRKVKNSVPHDIGDPWEEPFQLINSYPMHDVSEWRDLNSKFVLQVFRDSILAQDLSVDKTEGKFWNNYLKDMYDTCQVVMKKSMHFDIDKDGLIENGGTADQTFDTWVMTGASAYCGGLWLAALFAMRKMSETLGKSDDQRQYEELLTKGMESYDRKLWNGKCYNFDCSRKEYESIMADQLCGHWYLRCCGFDYEVFPQDKVRSSLRTVYENNVLEFGCGKKGAVNGFIDGHVDCFTIQSEEVWTGITYAVASHMIHEGMIAEAWKTAGGMYRFLSQEVGLAFQTPEAFYLNKYYRSLGYMRPLSVWSMQLAWESRKC